MSGRSAALVLCLAVPPSLARSAAFDVQARTEGQAYAIRRDFGQGQVEQRRRLVQYLDLAAFELVPREDAGLSVSVRYDVDFGVSAREEDGLDDVERARLQALDAVFHWNGLARGRLDLQLGRIVAVDPVSFHSFDGGRVTVRPVPWLGLTAFGGARVTGGSWIPASTFSPDGVRDSDERRADAGLPRFPCPGTTDPAAANRDCVDETLDDVATTFGGRLFVSQVPGGFGSGAGVEYRRALRAGDVIEELVGGTARYEIGPVAADAAAQYDLYVQRISALRLGVRWAALRALQLSAEASRWHASFSADSIFNLFDTHPYDEGRVRADWFPARVPARLYAWAGADHYFETVLPFAGTASDGGYGGAFGLGASGTLLGAATWLDTSYRDNVQGRQIWAQVGGQKDVTRRLGLDARVSFASMQDDVSERTSGEYLSGALGARWRLERRAQLALLLEDSTPQFERNEFRVFAFLNLGADWNTRRKP